MGGPSEPKDFEAAGHAGLEQKPPFNARDLLAAFKYSPVAQLLIQPDGQEFSIVAASDAYAQVIGSAAEERGSRPLSASIEQLTGRTLPEIFARYPDQDSASGAQQMLASLWKTISTRRADKVSVYGHSLGKLRHWNVQNTPILDERQRVAYILHTVEDATGKFVAEATGEPTQQSLKATGRRFRQLAEASGLGVLIADSEGGISYANPALLRLLGYTEEDVAAGNLRWDALTPPEYVPLDLEAIRQVRETGRCSPYEKVYLTKSGGRVPILIGASLLEPLNGRTDLAAFVLDLTERKQSAKGALDTLAVPSDFFKTRNDAFLMRLDEATRSLLDPNQILAVSVRMLSEKLGVDRCSYGRYAPDLTIDIKSDFVKEGVPTLTGRFELTYFGPELTRCLLSNVPYIVNDVEIDEMGDEDRAVFREVGIRAMIGIPLHKEGRLSAALGVAQFQNPRAWLPEEVDLVAAVAGRCWEAIERAHVMLEQQASEQRLRLAQRAARIGSFDWLLKEQRIIWSPELEALYGLPQGVFEGTWNDWSKRILAADAEHVHATITRCLAQLETECSYEFRALLPDGTSRWLLGQSQVLYDESCNADRMIGVNIDITARKQAEADLRHSEERLRAIFDGTLEHVGLLSPGGVLLEANRAALQFIGNARSEVVGKPIWETPWFSATPGAPELVRQAVEKAAAGELVRFKATLRRPDGESPTFDISLHPIRDEAGEVHLIVPEARDITEQEMAEDRLQRQWHTFDTALSNTPDLTYTFDREGRFTYANRQLCRVSQRSLKDTVGKSVAELYPSALASRILDQIRQVVETRQPLRAQTDFKLPTGDVREYEYIYAPVIGEDGEVTGIAGSTRDITERKQAEEQLRRSESQFRQLIDSLPQLVWCSSPEGRDELYNKQWLEYTGLTFDEVKGDGSRIIHPDDLPAAMERWKRSLQTGEPYEVEYRCRRFDGQYRWFLGRAQAVRDEQGQLLRWFGTCTDIHDKKESEAALRKAHRELEEFSYVASHDLQEPLRMVSIYAQLLLKGIATPDGRMAQYATFVRQGVRRMEALLGDLLTFSRIVHSEDPLGGEADLSDSLAEAISVLGSRIEECNASITAAPLPVVCGDSQQLAHIFQNLLSNSLKYRRPDRRPEIYISAVTNGLQAVISVRDNGIGFEPEYAQTIFGLFKRLHKDEYPGTGMGLAICKRIVERYGGRMWAEANPGEGSTFHFALPLPVQER